MATNEIIFPYFENGVFAGVRVTLVDEDFVIAPKDYQDGKMMSWRTAMDTLKAEGLTTWNYRQICLIMYFLNEINKVFEDNGGDNLNNWYWTCSEFTTDGAFKFDGRCGTLEALVKSSMWRIRPIKNLKAK